MTGPGDRESSSDRISIAVSRGELQLLVDALGAYEYWDCGVAYDLPFHNGVVYLPDDGHGFWAQTTPTREQEVGIELARVCRVLEAVLSELLREGSTFPTSGRRGE